MPSPLTVRLALILWAGCVLLLSCEEDEVPGPSELTDYRIIGLVADPPDVTIDEVVGGGTEVQVEAVDFHPADLTERRPTRRYGWTVCFSLGAADRFRCIDPERTLHEETMEPRYAFDLNLDTLSALAPQELGAFLGDPTAVEQSIDALCAPVDARACTRDTPCDAGAICVLGQCRPTPHTSPVPLVVKVEAIPDGEVGRSAARVIDLRFSGTANTNPEQADLRPDGLEPSTTDDGGPCPVFPLEPSTKEDISMVIEIDTETAETFQSRSAEGCETESEDSAFLVSWYTSHGKFKRDRTAMEDTENLLEVEDVITDPVRIYTALRDGRRGLTIRCVDLIPGP